MCVIVSTLPFHPQDPCLPVSQILLHSSHSYAVASTTAAHELLCDDCLSDQVNVHIRLVMRVSLAVSMIFVYASSSVALSSL